MYKKKLQEIIAAEKEKMAALIANGESEQRSLSEDELKEFEASEAKIKQCEASIKAYDKAFAEEEKRAEEDGEPETEETRSEAIAKAEREAFGAYVRGVAQGMNLEEVRSGTPLTFGENGAIVPTTIANEIIKKVEEISPLFAMATKYYDKGTLTIPYYDESESSIEVGYQEEFVEGTESGGKFKSIQLQGYLIGALTAVSRKLINNSNFDVVAEVIDIMARGFAKKLDHEILVGTSMKIDGISKAKQIVTAKAQDAITTDELIDCQEALPDEFQKNGIWVMHRETRKAVRKLKNAQGDYILNKDATSAWGYSLFGNPVYTSTEAPKMAQSAKAVLFIDPSGLAIKISEDLTIDLLRETYAKKHAVGVQGWMECDAKVKEEQKVSVLQMAGV